MGPPVANVIVHNQVPVYHERVIADKIVSSFWIVRSISSQNHPKFLANTATEKISQAGTK